MKILSLIISLQIILFLIAMSIIAYKHIMLAKQIKKDRQKISNP